MIPVPKYALLDGEIIHIGEKLINNDSWTDWLSNSFHFQLRATGSRLPFFEGSYDWITTQMERFGYEIPEAYTAKYQLPVFAKLIQMNRLFKGVGLKLYFRTRAPFKDLSLLVLPYPIAHENFQMNQKGLIVDLLPTSLSSYGKKSHEFAQDSLLLQGYERCKQEYEVDQFLLIGANGLLHDTPHSSILLVKGKKLFTPEHQGITAQFGIKKIIQEIAPKFSLNYIETGALLADHLLQADEVFLANDFNGIQWVKGYKEKRFFRKNSPLLLNELNERWNSEN